MSAVGLQNGPELLGIHLAGGNALLHCQSGSGTGSLTHAHAGRHDTDGTGGGGIGTDISAGQQQILHALGDEAAVRHAVEITGDFYGVPYRSLIAKGVKNLLLAGRNVSADSTAAGAIRVMPPCMGMGQASGTAAALAVKKGVTPREVDAQELRAVLKANGAHL